uniref:ApoA-I-binding protein 2 n=1 Tax=Meleagris gallopavo TaxID=9103 RepID=A0A803Y7I2_MELGA
MGCVGRDGRGTEGLWGLREAGGLCVCGVNQHLRGMGQWDLSGWMEMESARSMGSARMTMACHTCGVLPDIQGVAVSKAEAEAIEKELLEDYRFGRQQLIEIWGHACAVAVTKAFPLPSLPRKQPTVLVVCGPAQNGAIGLVCARHLRIFDYEPTIFYPKRSLDPLYRDFTTQCEKMDIPFLSYLPTEVQLINDAYNAVVDAVLGAEAELGEGRGPCAGILATLKHVRIPIVSLDVPSGWDVEAGSSGGISPDVLVSLMAPKQCARRFLGRQHFVAGRFVPYDVQKKFELNPPEYPGTECVVALSAPQ